MEHTEFVPLGSICQVKEFDFKVMIIARAVALQFESGPRYFDYGGCLYPQGLIGDKVVYFNADSITALFHRGFTDQADSDYVQAMSAELEGVHMPKGVPTETEGHMSQGAGEQEDKEESDGRN
ncbi:hypothetical protein KIM372_06190 [Bombiscardovia nodaiensis]|uniref:DUF4176 domain-containing protein n=1 Tax=Bombiscardovia nodaiensis TaxID=2932181 RepID=A0ABM8B7D3_9BIFI|nr:hypothetical protein KIM372_06190 [Bombiscardovia nodaiensis]